MNFKRFNIRLSSFQIIILGFVLVILTGTVLLMLPISSGKGTFTPFIDALFTSTSAACVTGLVVHDTATYWSLFGQAVILLLIQIGGMGVVTVSVAVTRLSGKKIGLMQRSTMQEAISAHNVGGIVRMTNFIIKIVVLAELIGAALMAPVFCKEFGAAKGLWYALFHSVSAFCNAGFDLMGVKGEYSSLTGYTGHPLINIAVMALIIFGGIGFLTWDDIKTNGIHFKRYRLQSKIILTVSGLLIILPAIYFFFVEFSKDEWSGLSGAERVLASLFQSVTTRTAGFNTVDLSKMTDSGQVIISLLMLIGGSPGSTAGGMKTTTVAVLFIAAFSVFRRFDDAQCFGRRISVEAVRHAVAILMMYITLFLGGGLIISLVEGLSVNICLFETASAIGTVGLSLGVTPGLGLLSRLILIMLMFLGRVGGLTVIFAAFSNKPTSFSKLPQEKITVG